ncbi:MAG: DUF6702 family protein [Pseudomonadota bacterium]
MATISRALLAIVVFAAASTTALAHQQKAALTIVLFNERSGNLEVMHRIEVHDAEHAAEDMWGFADIISDDDQQTKFAAYVRSRFSLRDENGDVIALTPIGHEIDGPHLWVYHEAPAPASAARLIVDDGILRDFWSDQYNLVNVERGGFRGSLTFHGGVGAQEIDLEDIKSRVPLQSSKQP